MVDAVKSSVAAIIPAWRGSEGIPFKTMTSFLGKPLLQYTIEFCCENFEQVFVSSNDIEILDFARQWATPILSEIHDADGLAKWVWKDALMRACAIAQVPEHSAYFELTSPLRSIDDVERCYHAIKDGDYDCAATVSKTPQPCGKALTIEFDSRGKKRFGEYEEGALTNKSRAGMKRTYHRNGCCYMALNKHILNGMMMEHSCCPVVIDRPVVNIDSPNDLLVAELLWGHYHG